MNFVGWVARLQMGSVSKKKMYSIKWGGVGGLVLNTLYIINILYLFTKNKYFQIWLKIVIQNFKILNFCFEILPPKHKLIVEFSF